MKAIQFDQPGSPEVLYIGNAEQPTPGREELLVKVKATALNRADLLQRRGLYPPPKGASPILGLEMAGEVLATGGSVEGHSAGDRVMALLPGGGYAEYVVIPQDMAMRIPAVMTYEQAAAIPEAFLTAYQALFFLGKLEKGEKILIHAGASGVGTAAIQLAKAKGIEDIMVTASAGKHATCKSLGATLAIDYKNENFVEVIRPLTRGQGVHFILDFIGGPYFEQNLASLATDGRLVMLGFLGGTKVDSMNLGNILVKRLTIMGSTLRNRRLDYKIALTEAFADFALPLFETAAMHPIIDRVYNWAEVVKAHQYMEANRNTGKIVLRVE